MMKKKYNQTFLNSQNIISVEYKAYTYYMNENKF